MPIDKAQHPSPEVTPSTGVEDKNVFFKTILSTYSNDNVRMFMVDGSTLRDPLTLPYCLDFTEGDNHMHNPDLVPVGEVWVDLDIAPTEVRAVMIHELTERRAMIEMGAEPGDPVLYEKAHNEFANPAEEYSRSHRDQLDELLLAELAIAPPYPLTVKSEPTEAVIMKTATKPIIRKSLSITVRKDANGVEEIVLNSGKPDRGGDRVFAKGVDTSDWQKNNVVMWLHDYKGTTPAAGIPLGTGSYIKATDDGLITGPIKWLENDPFVARVRNAWDQRVLKSVSIGFQPPDDNNDMPSNEFGGVDYKKCKLLEYSIVPIPMDADALRIGKDFPELMEKAPKQYSQAQLSDIIDELKCAIANVGLSAENQIELRRLSGSDTPVEIKTIVKSLSDTMDTLEGHHKSHAKCYKDCKDALVQMVDLCNGGKMMPEQSLISKILGK